MVMIFLQSYSLILFVEKVAFDSHSLIEHGHGDDHAHGHGHGNDNDKSLHSHHEHNELSSDKKKEDLSAPLVHPHAGGNKIDDNDNDSDEDEQAIKNVVSAKGKYSSFLQTRNIMKSGSMIRPDKALMRASLILNKNYEKDEINKYMVDPKKVDVEVSKDNHNHGHKEFIPNSNFTPYLLLIALSFHGLFEGIALGLQKGFNDTLFLFIAIISHKWAEAFTLGISFSKAQTDRQMFIRLILLFSFFTPVGILIGYLTSSSKLTEAIFLALSTG